MTSFGEKVRKAWFSVLALFEYKRVKIACILFVALIAGGITLLITLNNSQGDVASAQSDKTVYETIPPSTPKAEAPKLPDRFVKDSDFDKPIQLKVGDEPLQSYEFTNLTNSQFIEYGVKIAISNPSVLIAYITEVGVAKKEAYVFEAIGVGATELTLSCKTLKSKDTPVVLVFNITVIDDAPTDPTEPVNPTPTDPTNPTDPSDPTDPDEQADPTEPTDPITPDPIEPTESTDPTDPTDPTPPTEPTTPTPDPITHENGIHATLETLTNAVRITLTFYYDDELVAVDFGAPTVSCERGDVNISQDDNEFIISWVGDIGDFTIWFEIEYNGEVFKELICAHDFSL
jgi:hypothetical protein